MISIWAKQSSSSEKGGNSAIAMKKDFRIVGDGADEPEWLMALDR